MRSIRPPSLAFGDTVGVATTAGKPEPAELAAGKAILEQRWRVRCDADSMTSDGFLAGSDADRLDDIRKSLQDPERRAIIAARGGYGTTRLLDELDLGPLSADPRWVVGSSDLTALLIRLWTELCLQSIHGPMVARFPRTDPRDLEALFGLLEGRPWSCPDGLRPVIDGDARGPMVGGNLTVLAHLCGTVPVDFAQGCILFLEDVGERPYRLDRCMVQLRRGGYLDGLAGVVLGEFTDCDPAADGTTASRVLADVCSSLGVPVAASYPAAHGGRNAPFVHGGWVELRVEDGQVGLGPCDPT